MIKNDEKQTKKKKIIRQPINKNLKVKNNDKKEKIMIKIKKKQTNKQIINY